MSPTNEQAARNLPPGLHRLCDPRSLMLPLPPVRPRPQAKWGRVLPPHNPRSNFTKCFYDVANRSPHHLSSTPPEGVRPTDGHRNRRLAPQSRPCRGGPKHDEKCTLTIASGRMCPHWNPSRLYNSTSDTMQATSHRLQPDASADRGESRTTLTPLLHQAPGHGRRRCSDDQAELTKPIAHQPSC